MPTPLTVSLTTADDVRLAAHYRRATGGGSDGGSGQGGDRGGDRSVPGVVVAHGFTGSAENPWLTAICDRLAGHGLAVLAPDLRGHGRSAGLSTAGVREAADIAAAVAFLRADGVGPVATLGWSMGGTAVLRQAGLRQAGPSAEALPSRADAVVAVSAPGVWGERGTRAMRLVHWMHETRTGRAATRAVKHTRIDPGVAALRPEPPTLAVAGLAPRPLLLVHGDADHYFPLRHAYALSAAAPHAELWVEAGMGHAENASTPQLVDRIAEWITGSLGQAAAVGAAAGGGSATMGA